MRFMGVKIFFYLVVLTATCGLCFSGESSENLEDVAVRKMYELFEKLKGDEPITYEDEVYFFGHFPSPAVCELLEGLGYELDIDEEEGFIIKPAPPRFSPICELLRLNRDKFFLKEEGKRVLHTFCIGRISHIDVNDNTLVVKNENENDFAKRYGVTYKQSIGFTPVGGKLLFDAEPDEYIITTDFWGYSQHLEFPFYLNGKSITKELGFKKKEPDRYGLEHLEPEKETIEMLKEHLKKLEARADESGLF